MAESSPTQHYNRITTNVDKLISKHGSERAADLIESIALKKKPTTDSIDIHNLIISEIVKAFKINVKLLPTNKSVRYRKARESCFYLLYYYGNLSYGLIKEKFSSYPNTRQMVAKSVLRMDQIISLNSIDKEHYKIHASVEAVIIKFSNKK